MLARLHPLRLFLRDFSSSCRQHSGHDNPLGLPRKGEPPSMPRRGMPAKRRIAGVNRTIAVSSAKGGVGKSTIASNLALALLQHGASSGRPLRVGLLDLDIFGPSVPKLMGLENVGEPQLTDNGALLPLVNHGVPTMSIGYLISQAPDATVAWRGMMVQKAVQQLLFDVHWRDRDGRDLDALVIDMPPGTGDVQLTLGQLVIVDGAVIVTTPQDVALIDARKGIALFRRLGVPVIGGILNMSHFVCSNCSTAHQVFGSADAFERDAKSLDFKVLGRVPLDPEASSRGDSGRPVVLTAGNDLGASHALRGIGARVAENLGL